jgi:hypothetical protein
MQSRLFVSLGASLASLRGSLIVSGKSYDAYTAADHHQALGFRVLASAHLENYVESRCIEVAKLGVARIKKGKSSRSACALITWHAVRNSRAIPLERGEYFAYDRLDNALVAYEAAVQNKHGFTASALRSLVLPLGIKESELDSKLLDLLRGIADRRGAAAHTSVNRAKQMAQPEQEWLWIDEIMPLLQELDETLAEIVES